MHESRFPGLPVRPCRGNLLLVAATLYGLGSGPLPALSGPQAEPASQEVSQQTGATRPEQNSREKPLARTLSGRVVWLAEAIERRHGAQSVAEARERVLALETAEGELHPLLEDRRGRAFRRDERLRQRDVQLRVRQYSGCPSVQVIRVYAEKDDGLYELDYWCDICAIAMYELAPCDCCQGDIRLRERKIDVEATDDQ